MGRVADVLFAAPQVGRRYFSQESMNKLLEPTPEEVVQALLELQTA